MNKAPLTDRLCYAFDNVMSKGTIALISWLALVSIIVIVPISLVVWLTGLTPETSLDEQVWAYLMHA